MSLLTVAEIYQKSQELNQLEESQKNQKLGKLAETEIKVQG
jgi:hypothetical protein